MRKLWSKGKDSKKKKESAFTIRKWDPLYIIFEKHLYDFNYDSRDKFIQGVINEYVSYMVKQKVVIPPMWRPHLEANLKDEVCDMLVRKIYGCLSFEEFKEEKQ